MYTPCRDKIPRKQQTFAMRKTVVQQYLYIYTNAYIHDELIL